MAEIEKLLPNFPPGPLDIYRKQASFCWKKMITLVDGEDGVKLRFTYYRFFENDPLFHKRDFDNLDEARKLTTLRIYKMLHAKLLTDEDLIVNPESILSRTVAEIHYDPSFAVKFGLTFVMFKNVLLTLGNESHLDTYMACEEGKVAGSFALTEFGHGTNTKSMQTYAKFDPGSQEFILNSPNFEAAKCWSGPLGKCATHSIIWARLILPDGSDEGLHPFLVHIRNPENGQAYPGLIVGDMGKKAGLNGVDNGFIIFKNYRIPKSSLLNKVGDITPDGKYISHHKSKEKRAGSSFGALSGGRVTIIQICIAYVTKALTIGIRYAGVRKQFGPNEKEELPILEYQLIQCRLFPHLAATYCMKIFGNYFGRYYLETMIKGIIGNADQNMANSGPEIHALSSAAKPLASWLARDAIQECREACGGHGYLKASGLPELRECNDANCTYEGDNNVLQQQTSNWLVQLWMKRHNINAELLFDTPLQSVKFLLDEQRILKQQFKVVSVNELMFPETLLDAYKWLICYLLEITAHKLKLLQEQGGNQFTARNETQVFYAKTLSLVFIEHFVLSTCFNFALKEATSEPEIQNVLMLLISLYGIWSLEKHLSFLYQGEYLNEGRSSLLFKEAIINLCARLKPEAVSLADAIAPTDFILNSVLGNSDGQVYKHLEESMFNNPDTFKVPDWWHEILAMNSKL